MTDFLDVEDVLYLHTNQIDLYGGDHGVRAIDLLDSAIAQPKATFGGNYLHAFPFGMAAAYMFHIVQNHPFVDGNKRKGAVAAFAFLDLNGIDIDAPKGELYSTTLSVATGPADKDVIAVFFSFTCTMNVCVCQCTNQEIMGISLFSCLKFSDMLRFYDSAAGATSLAMPPCRVLPPTDTTGSAYKNSDFGAPLLACPTFAGIQGSCRCYTDNVTVVSVRFEARVTHLGLLRRTLSFPTPNRFIPAHSVSPLDLLFSTSTCVVRRE